LEDRRSVTRLVGGHAFSLVLLLCLVVNASAGEGRIIKIESFRNLPTGREFLFIWGEQGGFCLSDLSDVNFVLVPDTLPEEFRFESPSVTLKIHRARLLEVPRPIDLAEILEVCD
jgi:hypothetical protein